MKKQKHFFVSGLLSAAVVASAHAETTSSLTLNDTSEQSTETTTSASETQTQSDGVLSISDNQTDISDTTGGATATISGSVNVTGDTPATVVDIDSLPIVGGAVDVTGDTPATVVDIDSLPTVGGAVDVTDNATSTTVVDVNDIVETTATDDIGEVNQVDNTVINNGTVNFNTDTQTGSLTQSGGTLAGSATLTVAGLTTWTGGIQQGTGTTRAEGGLNLSGSGTKSVQGNRTLINVAEQTASWSDGLFNVNFGSVLVNEAEATFDVTGASRTLTGIGVFDNAGTLEVNLDNAEQVLQIQPTLTNTGTVDVQTGVLRLIGSSTSTGAYTSGPGGSLQFGFGTHNLTDTSRVTVPNVAFISGTSHINGTYEVDHTVINNGTVNFNTDTQTGSLTQSGGTLAGSATLTVARLTTWTGGIQQGAGTTRAEGGLNLSGSGTKSVQGNRTLINVAEQTASWSDGLFNVNFGSSLVNEAEATFDVTGASRTLTGIGVFHNAGTLEVNLDNAEQVLQIQPTLNNTGTVEVQKGTLRLTGGGNGNFTNLGTINVDSDSTFATSSSADFLNGASGRLRGTGTFAPFSTRDLVNQGTIAPGKEAIGNLTIAGDFTQANSGLLDIEIGETGSVDTLTITGNATFGGTLKVSSLGGFLPSVGDVFTLILLGGGASGTFDFVDTSAFSDLKFAAVYGDNDVKLLVSEVPIPAAFWLFTSAITTIIVIGKRQT